MIIMMIVGTDILGIATSQENLVTPYTQKYRGYGMPIALVVIEDIE